MLPDIEPFRRQDEAAVVNTRPVADVDIPAVADEFDAATNDAIVANANGRLALEDKLNVWRNPASLADNYPARSNNIKFTHAVLTCKKLCYRQLATAYHSSRTYSNSDFNVSISVFSASYSSIFLFRKFPVSAAFSEIPLGVRM